MSPISLPVGKGKHDRKVVAFINAFWKTQYRPPSVREIATACGVTSTSVVFHTLRRLAKTGNYTLIDGDARSIVPTWVKMAIESYDRAD
jgi:SOS-response transcriptional repressor LexA